MSHHPSPIPVVVASVCGHRLTGGDAPIETWTIPAVTITHCASCKPLIAIAYNHLVPQITTTTGFPSHEKPCANCAELIDLEEQMLTARSNWESFASKSPSTAGDQSTQENHQAERKTLVRASRQTLLVYNNAKNSNSCPGNLSCPTFNDQTTTPSPPQTTPYTPKTSPGRSPKSVTFDETQHHPDSETSRDRFTFLRHMTTRYVPGKYAHPDGDTWLNTSNPGLNGWLWGFKGEREEDFELNRERSEKAPLSWDAFKELLDKERERRFSTGVRDNRVENPTSMGLNFLCANELDKVVLKGPKEESHEGKAEEESISYGLDSSDSDSDSDNDSPRNDDSTEGSQLSGSESIIASLKRNKDDDEEGWTLGDFQDKEEVFAIRIMGRGDMVSPTTEQPGSGKNNGFTMPVSEK